MSDTIVTDMLKLLVLMAVGGAVVLFIVIKVVALFIKTLGENETPVASAPAAQIKAATEPIVWPTATADSHSRLRWGLVARVALLALLPNLLWFYQAFGMLANGSYLLSVDRPNGNLLLFGGLFGLPSVVLAVWLWRNKRPSMAVGIVLSSMSLAAPLLMWPTPQHQQEAAAEQVIVDVPPPPTTDATTVATQAEQMPRFPGGSDSLRQTIRRNLHYPPLLRADQRSGTVSLSYVVGVDGRVLDVQVIQPLGPAFDEEATRVVQALPAFSPARQHNEIVAVRCTLDVKFRPPAVQAW